MPLNSKCFNIKSNRYKKYGLWPSIIFRRICCVTLTNWSLKYQNSIVRLFLLWQWKNGVVLQLRLKHRPCRGFTTKNRNNTASLNREFANNNTKHLTNGRWFFTEQSGNVAASPHQNGNEPSDTRFGNEWHCSSLLAFGVVPRSCIHTYNTYVASHSFSRELNLKTSETFVYQLDSIAPSLRNHYHNSVWYLSWLAILIADVGFDNRTTPLYYLRFFFSEKKTTASRKKGEKNENETITLYIWVFVLDVLPMRRQ